MKWEANVGPHAGHWASRDQKRPNRGYAHEFDEYGGASITGLFINSNKTGEPFCIPWQDDEIHSILSRLRLWQEKYNPVPGPIGPEQYLDNPKNYPSITKEKMPEIFALFRMPPNQFSLYKGRPPSQSECDKAWQVIMLEIERRYNLENPEEPISIVKRQAKSKRPQGSIYNPHGLRVRGLSNLHRCGVPIELISKMVAGHSSIIMTLYYLHYEPHIIHDMLSKAAVESQAQSARDFITSYKSWSIEQARSRSVAADPDCD